KEELASSIGKCVLIDPGHHDILYCMHEDSTVENKRTHRYTSNQSAIETKSREFSKLHENLKSDAMKEAELSLSGHTSSTVNCEKFARYLEEKARVTPVLHS
ncbi:hypothetical protein BDF14DRAFT_1737813, partial [Spinellus fusiger]